MITLTTAARYHFGRSSNPVWYAVIHKESIDTWTIDGSTYDAVCFSAGVPGWSAPSGWFLSTDRMNAKSFKDITYKLPIGIQRGGVAAINDFTFAVSNLNGLLRDFEDGGVNLDGRRVEIWVSPDNSLTTRDDDVQVAGGIITDIPNKKNSAEFRGEGTERSYTRQCPPNIYDPETVDLDNIHLANETRGEPVPMVFGSHDMAEGFTVTDAALVGSTDYGHTVQFSDETLGPLAGGSGWAMKWGDSGLLAANENGMADVDWTISQLAQSAGKGMWFYADVGSVYLYLLLKIRFSGGPSQPAYYGAWNPAGPIDDIEGNYAIVYGGAAIGGSGIASYSGVIYKYPRLSVAMDITGIQVGGHHKAAWSDNGSEYQHVMINEVLPPAAADLYPAGGGNCWYHQKNSWVANEDFTTNLVMSINGAAPATDLTGLSRCFLVFYNRNGHTITAGTDFYLFDINTIVLGKIDFPARGFYMGMGGYKDDNTIVPSNFKLLENPAHIAAFLWSKISGAGIDALNIQEFRDTAATLDERLYPFFLEFSKNIREQKDVEDYIGELCEEGGLWTWFDRTGSVRCFPDGPRQDSESVTMLERWMLAPDLLDKWELTPLNKLVQDFTLRYHHNPVKDDFDQTLFCNKDTASNDVPAASQTKCGDSVDRFNLELQKTFDLEWIRSRGAALIQLECLIDWHTTRRWIIEWTSDLVLAKMEIGDVVSLASEVSDALELPASLAAAEFRISQVRFSPSKNTVKFKAVQT